MKSIVIGSEGFLGSKVIERLKRSESIDILSGWDVKDASQNDGDYSQVDITNAEAVRDHLSAAKPDGILHFATYVDANAPGRELMVQIEGTRNLLQAALEQKIERVFIPSSSDVYRIKDGIVELCRLCSNNRIVETLVSDYQRKGLDIRTIKFPQVCGPREHPVGEPRRYRSVLEGLLGNRPVETRLSPQPIPYIHATDAIEMIMRRWFSKTVGENFMQTPAVYISPEALISEATAITGLHPKVSHQESAVQYLFEQDIDGEAFSLLYDIRLKLNTSRILLERYMSDIANDLEEDELEEVA